MSEDFKIWWHREGSGMPPKKGEEACEHVERVSAIAWSNGAYKAKESLEAENARLKAEVERLTAFTTRTIIPNEELQSQVERLRNLGIKLESKIDALLAQVERLTKAGDAMADALWEYCHCQDCEETCDQWNDAKRTAKKGGQP